MKDWKKPKNQMPHEYLDRQAKDTLKGLKLSKENPKESKLMTKDPGKKWIVDDYLS